MWRLPDALKTTFLHPQWLSLRFHRLSRRCLLEIENCLVLDIGSGDSEHAELLHPSCILYRIDYPTTNARYRLAPDTFADATAIPIAPERVDAVLLLEVLEHIPEDSKVLSEIRSVLKPGGKLYMSVPFIYPLHDAPYDFRRYTVHGLRRLLEKHGYTVVRELCHGNSFITAMQLFNLSLLEVVRDLYVQNRVASLLVALLFYPLCLCINIIALPFTLIRGTHASCFGYFVTAVKE